VEPDELARVAFDWARMGGNLGCIPVVDDTQIERVAGADSCRVSGNGCGACVVRESMVCRVRYVTTMCVESRFLYWLICFLALVWLFMACAWLFAARVSLHDNRHTCVCDSSQL
jgi:hypothetical protein